MIASEGDAPTVLAEATVAVQKATKEAQTTSQSIAAAIEAGRQPGAFLDQLANLTRQVPLHSLAVAFRVGFIAVRHR